MENLIKIVEENIRASLLISVVLIILTIIIMTGLVDIANAFGRRNK